MEFFATMPAKPPTEYERRLAGQPIRQLEPWERTVLLELASAAGLSDTLTTSAALDGYRIREMLDGGMGSIRFVVTTECRTGDRFNVAERFYNASTELSVCAAID